MLADLSATYDGSRCCAIGALHLAAAGRAAHLNGNYESALGHSSCALKLLSVSVPLIDFGLGEPAPVSSNHVLIVRRLLTDRAAAALKLGLWVRALCDTNVALALGGGVRCVLLRAKALLRIGACTTAVRLIAPYVDTRVASWRERRLQLACAVLSAAARAREARTLHRIATMLDQPNRRGPLPGDLAFVHGGLELRSYDGRGRGWQARADIAAGTLLLVDPAVLPTVPPQASLTEEETLPLPRAVASALRKGGQQAECLKELLACLHPLDDEGDGLPMLRDLVAAPYLAAIGVAAALSSDAMVRLDRKLQR